MTIEVDVKEIKELLSVLNEKIDMLIETRETLSLMILAEKSQRIPYERARDLLNDDIKVRYR